MFVFCDICYVWLVVVCVIVMQDGECKMILICDYYFCQLMWY